MGIWSTEKKYLSASGLLAIVRKSFLKIKEPLGSVKEGRIPLVDCLMSGLALFGLKFPSLLQFDQRKDEAIIRHNLTTLYQVEKAPSDTYMRERLDIIDPFYLRPAFCKLFAHLQRGKVLEDYLFLGQYYLLPLDGTGFFSSNTIHCSCCCKKSHRDGSYTYYHQILTGAIVHPDLRTVIPLCPEPISNGDGSTKNDCERNAAKRFIRDFRKEHPFLNVIVTQDALSSNGPHLKELKKASMHYIIGVKPDGNASLFEWIKGLNLEEIKLEKDGCCFCIRFINSIPLNGEHPEFEVNFFEAWIEDPKQGKKHFSWITDIHITKNNVYELMRGGRARWKIENETFNTLKNQGYKFEHNFGHGNQHLCHVFACLMIMAFLIDQMQQHCCGLFQAAVKKAGSRSSLWMLVRSFFVSYFIDSWEDLYHSIAYGFKGAKLTPNTS